MGKSKLSFTFGVGLMCSTSVSINPKTQSTRSRANIISDFVGRLWYEWGLIFVYNIIFKTSEKIVCCHPYSASPSCLA